MSTTSTISKKSAVSDPEQVSETMPKRKKMTVPAFTAAKGGRPLVCLTAYTAHVAHIVDEQADMILVGDSLGMVIHGMPNTLGVTMEHMIMHGQAVMRGAEKALVVVDMPFGSFEESPEVAFRNAARLIKETGCTAVKLEGGREMAPTIRHLTNRGIPVMAHVGLMPQQMNTAGGFKAVREKDQFDEVIKDAQAVEEAGAFSVVVEGVAVRLANKITKSVGIPTIGIGASVECDGQILVFEDMIGLFPRVPTFVKRYGNMEEMMRDAVERYSSEVRERKFPSDDYTYKMKAD
ncbi:3-methyl-2-oxobutanoate hydroxymethyltransferase [Amylibacter ulvae]|uniref:3-methyl-2-oxobutanoate hydroxymethyltransferase n=1 Tax=Paramylibacter ulvae TaxID=1651968 RepID=A0ABQ3D3J8_9RHOB|nr:3-methyl-2-oxobutanoate hydroxymethyltransferase [Amylibacter ulvae]